LRACFQVFENNDKNGNDEWAAVVTANAQLGSGGKVSKKLTVPFGDFLFTSLRRAALLEMMNAPRLSRRTRQGRGGKVSKKLICPVYTITPVDWKRALLGAVPFVGDRS
jgi:hypothetical protein